MGLKWTMLLSAFLIISGWFGDTSAKLIDNGNGTVTDTTTGLVWQQATPGIYIWQEAMDYCKNLNLAQHSDWRSPTRDELHSIQSPYVRGRIISTTFFPDTVSSWYWSSTGGLPFLDWAFAVPFNGGYDYGCDVRSHMPIRAVRNDLENSLLSVTPTIQKPEKDEGTTSFNVSNTGIGNMSWIAEVPSYYDWLTITSGDSGTNDGVVNCAYTANISTSTRTAYIRVNAEGAVGSPISVKVYQARGESEDNDNDGDGYTENQGDCKDDDSTVNPGAAEICNGKDDNCDGNVDEGCLIGDVDGDRTLDLMDAIIALQIMCATDLNDQNISLGADCNNDDAIGIEEVIYILEKIAGLRELL